MGCIVLILTLSILACAPKKVTIQSSPLFKPATIDTIAIVPFKPLASPQETSSVPTEMVTAPTEIRSQFELPSAGRPAWGGPQRQKRTVSDATARRITDMVYSSLKNRAGINVLPPERVIQALPKGALATKNVPLRETAQQVDSVLDVDAVIVGLVRTYREREGTKIAAVSAEVGFEVHLLNPSDGKILWTGEYYEEQKPMNQDLIGFFERKGAFVTADALAQYGVQKMMKEFPVGN